MVARVRREQPELLSDTERNDDAPNSAPLGAMGSLLSRLDMLPCTDDGGSISELKDNIRSISDMLKKLSEAHDPPLTANYWMKHARELSYDIEAYLDDLDAQTEDNLNDSDSKKEDNPVDSDAKLEDCMDDSDDETEYSVDDSDAETKDSVEDSYGSIQDSICSSGFRTRAKGMIERYKMFSLDSVPNSPTATTTIVCPRPSRDVVLVGMGNQVTKLISLLQPKDENDNQLKIVSIHGDEGIGKSTLMQEIWRVSFKEKEIWHELESEVNIKRAFVRIGKKPDVRMILRSILSQVSVQEPAKDSGVANLIRDIRKHLEQKRYFIIVDDVRSESVWDVVGRAFPHCSVGSRIIATTSDKEVALACCSYVRQHNYIMEPLNVGDCKELFIKTVVGFRTVNLQLSSDVSDEIKRKSGGLPLAIMWTAILVASQPEIKEKLCQLEIEQGLSKMEKEQNLDSDVKKFLDRSLRTESTPVEILNQVLNLCYNSLPHYLKTCLLYLSVYPENYFFLKEDLVKLWIAEGFICTSVEDKIEVAGRYFDVLVSLGLIQRMDINCNKQHRQGEVHVVEDEGVPYVVHPTVFDFITCKSVEDNFITIIDYSQSTVALKDKIHRLSLHFGSATYVTTPAGLSQVRTLSFMGLLGCMPSLVEFKIVRVMILDLWADDEDKIFSLTEICKLLLLKYLQVSCNVTVELPGEMGCLKLLETLEINSRIRAVPSDILNLPRLSYVRLEGKTGPTMHLFPPNFNVERAPQDVEHSSSHMASQITEVDLDPTLIEPVEKHQVLVTSGTGDYYTTEQPINLDKMPVKDRNEHADWGMPQVSDVTQDDSPPQEKSGFTKFSLPELEIATANFSEVKVIGQGSFATVYKGVLRDGQKVAIKKIHYPYQLSMEHICDKLRHVSKLEHKNVVQLLGYGYADCEDYVFLVEENMPHGSMDNIIYGSEFGWSFRLQLIQGIAQGLHYLHEQRFVHLDLKPSNILLDSDISPKITDFGRAKMLDQGDDVAFEDTDDYLLAGTMGYMPPEYIGEGIVSTMYDVYSFGVVVLETISGMCRTEPARHQASIEWAWAAWEVGQMEELLDPSLCAESQLKEVRRCMQIGLLCTQSDRGDRPPMLDIVKMLDNKKDLPTPKQPKYTKVPRN